MIEQSLGITKIEKYTQRHPTRPFPTSSPFWSSLPSSQQDTTETKEASNCSASHSSTLHIPPPHTLILNPNTHSAPPPLEIPLLGIRNKLGLAVARQRAAEVDVHDARVAVAARAGRPHLAGVGLGHERDPLVDGAVAVVGDGAGDGVLFF